MSIKEYMFAVISKTSSQAKRQILLNKFLLKVFYQHQQIHRQYLNHLDMTIKSFVDEVLNLAVARVRCYVRPTEANSSNLSPV